MNSARRAAAPLSAYVLHSWDWSETSLVVELFTRERGRLAVAAKGAKRPYSQLRAVLLPFQHLLVQLGRAPADEAAEVHLLRSAERAGGPPMPEGAALFAGFYLNELLMKLSARQDPHPALHDAYAQALQTLQQADEAALQLTLRCFELALLRETGVLPDLGRATLTLEPLRPGAAYTLRAESGVVETRAAGVPGGALVAIEGALACGDGLALRQAVRPVMAALRAPLRELLHYHLGAASLRTREVMLDINKLADARLPLR